MLNPDFDIRPLGYAILKQAVFDAKGGDNSARLWIATDGLFYLDALGSAISDETIRKFADGLRKRTGRKKAEYWQTKARKAAKTPQEAI